MLAAALWGHLWHSALVHAFCDNQTVVDVISKLVADPNLMHLIRCLYFVSAATCMAVKTHQLVHYLEMTVIFSVLSIRRLLQNQI